MSKAKREAILTAQEAIKDSLLVVNEAERHWRREHETFNAAVTSGSIHLISRTSAVSGYLRLMATYEAVVDAMYAHAENINHLKKLAGNI